MVQRVELLMAAAVLCVAGTVLDSWTAQPAARYLLTVAVADHHTVTLDEDFELLHGDHAFFEGHFYSDKAPYQPLLSVPFYVGYRALGGDAFPGSAEQPDPDKSFHWGRWWVGFWTAAVPGALLCVVMRRLVAQSFPTHATKVALALTFGTIILPFSGLMFGHVLSTLFLASGWLLLRRRTIVPSVAFWAGVLLAAGVGTEFPVALPAAIVFVAAIAAHGARMACWTLAGGVVGGLPLLAYNAVAFGGPFETAYQGRLPNFQGSGALGVYNLVWPKGEELAKAMVGDRGLLTLTSVCGVALVFALRAVIRRDHGVRDGLIASSTVLLLWLMSAGIDGYGGSSPGPRYLMPAIPFLAIPLAEGWNRAPRLTSVFAVISAIPMILATVTFPLIETNYKGAVRVWINIIMDGDVMRSVPGELVGNAGLYLLMAAGVACIGAALREPPEGAGPQRAGPQ